MQSEDTHDKAIDNENDPTLLLIKGSCSDRDASRTYVKKAATAILATFQKHGEVHMRCVGAASLNNATKAFIIALGDAVTKGVNLAMVPSFKTVNFDNDPGGPKTAIVLKVIEV